MNDKNLYRGKRVDNGEWVDGDLIHRQIRGCVLAIIRISDYEEYEVIPESVGQFTGLHDKNEKKIFEGNIVRVTEGMYGYKSTYHSYVEEVKFYNKGVAVFLPFDNSDIVEVEVIGNIYDNKELLR